MIFIRNNDLGGSNNLFNEECLLSMDFNGNFRDESIYANHATPLGTTSPTFVTGRRGDEQCAYFDNSGLKTIKNVPIRGKVATISFWMRSAEENTEKILVELSPNYNRTSALIIVSKPEGVSAGARSTNGTYNTILVTESKAEWKHYAYVFDRTQPGNKQIDLYINGQPRDYYKQFSSTHTEDFFDNHIHIGMRGVNKSLPFKGWIQELKIFQKALTPSEIIALYNN